MPLSLRDAGYLWDIVDSCRAAVQATEGLDFAAYESNRVAQLAVERCIEIVGEAARRLSEDFKETHPEIPWSKIVGQRNVLAHDYREILQEKLWLVVREEMPLLIERLAPEIPEPPAAPPVEKG
jgi:uncharacterized protein with HEPN domain